MECPFEQLPLEEEMLEHGSTPGVMDTWRMANVADIQWSVLDCPFCNSAVKEEAHLQSNWLGPENIAIPSFSEGEWPATVLAPCLAELRPASGDYVP